jgi:vitamin-K-epoxide reductase (warfarin-sensitive)
VLAQVAFLALLGFGVSAYGYFLERKTRRNAQYKAACDLSDKISCTRAFTSPYAKMIFGISNTVIGMAFYTGMFVLALLGLTKLAFLGAIVACVASIGFAYILIFKIHTLCLICTTIYGINAALLLVTYNLQ